MTKAKCSKCKIEKPATLEYFTKNGNKLSSWCRKCKQANDRIYSRRYREENPEWKKENNKINQALVNELVKEYNLKYPERLRAGNILHYAIKIGRIKRQPCEICGNPKSHGHHNDYAYPLEILWLCAKHHKALHYNLLEVGNIN